MAWKNHERPITRICTGDCGQELPFDEEHFQFAIRRRCLKDGTPKIYYEAISGQCRTCRNAMQREIQSIDRVLAEKRIRKVDQRALAEAVWLVRKGGMSQRSAARQMGISNDSVWRAIRDGRTFPRPLRLHLEPVVKIVKRETQMKGITLSELCVSTGLNDRVLRKRNDSEGISVLVVDTLLTQLGVEHLLAELEETALIRVAPD